MIQGLHRRHRRRCRPASFCKIAISALPNQEAAPLDRWLVSYLRQDPTVDIAGAVQTGTQVSGRDAILWNGTLNGVSTTLAYVAGDGLVYEIAPSVVADPAATVISEDACNDSFEMILTNLIITAQ